MKLLSLMIVLCLAATVAHADTLYNFNATLADGGSLTGTLTFGFVTVPCPFGCTTITGLEVTAENFTIKDGEAVYAFNNSYPSSSFVGTALSTPYSNGFYTVLGQAGPEFTLDLQGEFPLQFSPLGPICSNSNPCPGFVYYRSSFNIGGASINVGSGAITSAAAPEPSTLALLATGILGVAGANRRRLLGL